MIGSILQGLFIGGLLFLGDLYYLGGFFTSLIDRIFHGAPKLISYSPSSPDRYITYHDGKTCRDGSLDMRCRENSSMAKYGDYTSVDLD